MAILVLACTAILRIYYYQEKYYAAVGNLLDVSFRASREV